MTTPEQRDTPVLTADARRTLTDLVGVDERIRLLTARLDALPETAEVERLEEEAEARRRRDLGTRRIAHDMSGALHRLRSDAARLRERRRDDIAGLRADTDVDRRRDLRHDLAVAERRLAEVEADIAREERTLATFGHAGATGDAAAAASDGAVPAEDAALTHARAEEKEVTAEIRHQLAELTGRSTTLRGQLPTEILTRYEQCEREQGTGAAELSGSTCRCCCISLDTATVRRFANTPPDRLVTCPECGVLLIRPEA